MHTRPQLPALTGLRFLAAYYVVVYHFARPLLASAPDWIRGFADNGYVSVNFFFVLSGFVLAYTYLGRDDNRLDWKSFWVARFARIYPAYFVGILLMAPFAVYDIRKASASIFDVFVTSGIDVSLSALLVQAWIPGKATVWNFPGWSLSVEAALYAMFPLSAVWIARRSRTQLLWLVAGLWLVGLLAPALDIGINPESLAGAGFRGRPSDLWFSAVSYFPLVHLPAFLVGVASGRLFLLQGPRFGWRLVLATALLIGLVLSFGRALPFPLLQVGLLSPAYALLIYALGSANGYAARLLGSPTMRLLGEASFALYIFQAPVWRWEEAVIARLLGNEAASSAWFFVGYSVSLVLISIASLHLLENPARRLLRRVLDRPVGIAGSIRLAAATS